MIYRRLLLISIIIFVFLATAQVFVISQSSTRQVGTPTCQIFTSGSGLRCARIQCDATGHFITQTNDGTGGCTPTHPRDQGREDCETIGRCPIVERISCSADNKSAGYAFKCPEDEFSTTRSFPSIICPVTCPGCPTHGPGKPCRRAVWNTTYCSWDRTPCDIGGGGCGCGSGFTVTGERFTKEISPNLCSPCDPDPYELNACYNSGGTYDWSYCVCGQSPIVIDILGNGFNLTSAVNGIRFDINGDGVQEQLAWTSANSDDVWLALDRNNNGIIDDGTELFGNNTPQPLPSAGEQKNGFLALAVYDKLENGGNNDGQIDSRDSIFAQLKLWQDTNHNGISETSEMQDLSASVIRLIELDYRESRRTDEFGNRFRYRAKVKDGRGAQVGRWAWDVFLVTQP